MAISVPSGVSDLAAPLGAAVYSLLLVLGGAAIAPLIQGRESQRTFRRAKADRLEVHYSDVLASAWAMNDILVLPNGKPIPSEWLELRAAADRALVRLALEADAAEVKKTYRDVAHFYESWRRNNDYVQINPNAPDYADAKNEMRRDADRVRAGVDELEGAARVHLDKLRK